MINKGVEHTKVRKNRGIVKLMNGKKKSKSFLLLLVVTIYMRDEKEECDV